MRLFGSSKPGVSRRQAFKVFGTGAVAIAAYEVLDSEIRYPLRPAARTGDNPLVPENAQAGHDWRAKANGRKDVNDLKRQIQGWASTDSVSPGETIDFHVSAHASSPDCTISIYRVGHYGGTGSRLMTTSPTVQAQACEVPKFTKDFGTINCPWPKTWSLQIPQDWKSGIYIAAFDGADGHRGYHPFTVRELNRASDILAIQPTTTYQAYNIWPMDKVTGKSFYKGYDDRGILGSLEYRAIKVSYNRPYAQHGLPLLFELDAAFARWAEEHGHDVTYATSVDLHEGRIDPEKYSMMVYAGHDEYWSTEMRRNAEAAYAAGTHQAFLAANSMYWHVRVEDGGRTVTCYKEKDLKDPDGGENGPTIRWRKLQKKGKAAEQGFLGVQYNGILDYPVPMLVQNTDHWVWEGTGLKDGDALPNLVAGEADGFDPEMPRPKGVQQVLLSNSPYPDSLGRGTRIQSTSLCVNKRGTMMFVAGTYHWSLALAEEGYQDERVRRAMSNVVGRMLAQRES